MEQIFHHHEAFLQRIFLLAAFAALESPQLLDDPRAGLKLTKTIMT